MDNTVLSVPADHHGCLSTHTEDDVAGSEILLAHAVSFTFCMLQVIRKVDVYLRPGLECVHSSHMTDFD